MDSVTFATGVADVANSAEESDDAFDFASLYQLWFPPVYRWIRALAGPGVDAEDLAQEVFIIARRKIGRFDGTNIGGWLYRIAQLTVRDHRRRAWFRKIFLRSRDVALDELTSPDDSIEECVDREHARQRLYRLIKQLNPRWRDSFLLFEIAGLNGEEISRLKGIPPATVRTHLFRARKELVQLIAAQRRSEP